mmetsp:Transcript_130430/g.278716  ORF Transcript_130430/g.278716 Transcript_130430/m.278716 type:complete len:83 (-) Transcript_130430:458-706(-)
MGMMWRAFGASVVRAELSGRAGASAAAFGAALDVGAGAGFEVVGAGVATTSVVPSAAVVTMDDGTGVTTDSGVFENTKPVTA